MFCFICGWPIHYYWQTPPLPTSLPFEWVIRGVSGFYRARLWLIVPIMQRNALLRIRIALKWFMHFQIIIINPKGAASQPASSNKNNENNNGNRAEQVPFGFLPRWKSFKFIASCISRPALLISPRHFGHYPWPIFYHHLAGKVFEKSRILNIIYFNAYPSRDELLRELQYMENVKDENFSFDPVVALIN